MRQNNFTIKQLNKSFFYVTSGFVEDRGGSGNFQSGCPSQSVTNLESSLCRGLLPEDLTHLSQTEVPVPAESVVSRGLLLQGQEPPVLRESAGRALLEKALPSSLDQGQPSRQKRSVKNPWRITTGRSTSEIPATQTRARMKASE